MTRLALERRWCNREERLHHSVTIEKVIKRYIQTHYTNVFYLLVFVLLFVAVVLCDVVGTTLRKGEEGREYILSTRCAPWTVGHDYFSFPARYITLYKGRILEPLLPYSERWCDNNNGVLSHPNLTNLRSAQRSLSLSLSLSHFSLSPSLGTCCIVMTAVYLKRHGKERSVAQAAPFCTTERIWAHPASTS